MDFDYDQGEEYGGRILWPRVGVFVLAAFIFLFLGRCTAGGGGVDEGALAAAVASNSEAQTLLAERDTTIADLQQRLVDAQSTGTQPTTGTPGGQTGSEGVVATDGATEGGVAPVNPGTYVVQEGDTLSTIAEAVYGDPLAFAPIASANNLGGDNVLQVGQTLTIPDNPDAGQ